MKSALIVVLLLVPLSAPAMEWKHFRPSTNIERRDTIRVQPWPDKDPVINWVLPPRWPKKETGNEVSTR